MKNKKQPPVNLLEELVRQCDEEMNVRQLTEHHVCQALQGFFRDCITLSCRQPVPLQRLSIVFRDAVTVVVHEA